MNTLQNHGVSEEQIALLRRVQELSFAKLETELFLDTHPENREALMHLNQLRTELGAALETFRQKGWALTTDDVEGNSWSWVETPFPWEF